MSLITELGGYEKAREICLGNEEDWMFYSIKKDWYSDIKHDESFVFIEGLKQELLQYRKNHSIFEVGDRLVNKYAEYTDKILVVSRVNHKALWFRGLAVGGFVRESFRHADKDEIQANKRLKF